jgi:hypothetical protein
MQEIKPTYVTFEQAKLLAEKSFDEFCSHYYINDFQNFKHDGMLHKCGLPNECDSKNIFQYVKRKNQPHLCNAPEQWQIIEWLRVNHGIWVDVSLNQFSKPKDLQWMYSIVFLEDCTYSHSSKSYNSPQEAYSSAFDYILNNNLI